MDKNIKNGTRTPIKREMLGLIAWFLIYITISLQDIWCSGIEWDQSINSIPHLKWLKWIKISPSLIQINILRCYFNDKYISQLHIFVDANVAAFAAIFDLNSVTTYDVHWCLQRIKLLRLNCSLFHASSCRRLF